MQKGAVDHAGLPVDGRAADIRSLRQLTVLVTAGLVCTVFIFLFLVLAAMQAVSTINTMASDRERLQVEHAVAAMPGGMNAITLAAMADTLALDSARLTGAAQVAADELSVPVFAGSHDVVAWKPHLLGTRAFLEIAPLRIALGTLFVAIVASIGVRVHILGGRLDRRRADAARLALTDALTGLGNRLAFDDALQLRCEAARTGPGCVLVLLDLDGFKAINDAHGHAAGDAVLRRVAEVLRACAAPGDLVARIGGDEFAVLCSGEGLDGFIAAVQRGLGQRPQGAGPAIDVVASMGVARSEDFPGGPSHLAQAADAALYRAKRDGRGLAELAIPETLSAPRYAA